MRGNALADLRHFYQFGAGRGSARPSPWPLYLTPSGFLLVESEALITVKANTAAGDLFAGAVSVTWLLTNYSGRMVLLDLVFPLVLFAIMSFSFRKSVKKLRLELFDDRVVGPNPNLRDSLRGRRSEIPLNKLGKDSIPKLPRLSMFSLADKRELRITANDGSEIHIGGVGILYDLEEVKRFLSSLKDRVNEV